MKKFVLLTALIMVGIGILFLTFADRTSPQRGKETKEEVVDAYLRALEHEDKDAILFLIPQTHSADEEARVKIEQFGGHILRDVKVDYRTDFGPVHIGAAIQAKYADSQDKEKEFQDIISLEQIDGRWYLILGHTREALPFSPSRIEP
jgi:hypothetical protein